MGNIERINMHFKREALINLCVVLVPLILFAAIVLWFAIKRFGHILLEWLK
jgi:hypothetical protein